MRSGRLHRQKTAPAWFISGPSSLFSYAVRAVYVGKAAAGSWRGGVLYRAVGERSSLGRQRSRNSAFGDDVRNILTGRFRGVSVWQYLCVLLREAFSPYAKMTSAPLFAVVPSFMLDALRLSSPSFLVGEPPRA